MLEWKKERKAEAIIRSAGDKLQQASAQVEEVRKLLLEKFGGLYEPLEEGLDEGSEALVKAGLTPEWAQALAEVSKSKIRLERSKVRATVSVSCHKPGGVDIIRQSLAAGMKVRKPRGSEIKVYTIAAPKYRVEVKAASFETAEKALNSAVEEILSSAKKAGGEGRKLG
jgi:translation initiation factor 2 subunit 1